MSGSKIKGSSKPFPGKKKKRTEKAEQANVKKKKKKIRPQAEQSHPELECFIRRMLTSSPCHFHHANTNLESPLWRQSMAECLKSQRHCLSKTTIRSSIVWSSVGQKAGDSLHALKSRRTASYTARNTLSDTGPFCGRQWSNPFEVVSLRTAERGREGELQLFWLSPLDLSALIV